MPGPEDQRLRLDALAHQPLGLVLGAVVGVREALALVEHVLLEDALVLPATAIELVWWKRPTSIELANSITCCVPSMLARSMASSSAVMS